MLGFGVFQTRDELVDLPNLAPLHAGCVLQTNAAHGRRAIGFAASG